MARTYKRGGNLRDAIRRAREIGVRVTLNAAGEVVFWSKHLTPPRWTANGHRKDTAWGVHQFLKRAARAAEAHR